MPCIHDRGDRDLAIDELLKQLAAGSGRVSVGDDDHVLLTRTQRLKPLVGQFERGREVRHVPHHHRLGRGNRLLLVTRLLHGKRPTSAVDV